MTESLGVTDADFLTDRSPFQTFRIPNRYMIATIPIPTGNPDTDPSSYPLARVIYDSPVMPKTDRLGITEGFFDWVKQVNSRQIEVINHRLAWAESLMADGQTETPYEMAVVFTDGEERLTVWMTFNDQYCPEVSLMNYLFTAHAPSERLLETLRVWERFQPPSLSWRSRND